jgi:hypothetical protein
VCVRDSGLVSVTDSRFCVCVKVAGPVILTVGAVCVFLCNSGWESDTDSRCCVCMRVTVAWSVILTVGVVCV